MKNILFDQQQTTVVATFDELINTKFQGDCNAICWSRHLVGDFEEIVAKLECKAHVTEVFIDTLLALQLSENAHLARTLILKDFQLLTNIGASPVLNLIKSYPRDEALDFIATDVYSYHIDRSPIETDTFLCTYHGAASEILPNDQVEKTVLIPEIRAKLKQLHDGSEAAFETFLRDNFFDLHYQAKFDSQPVSLGSGHLWRLAVDHPTQQVLPCVHRAPAEKDGEYRLLLIC